jgi:toxin CcdB
MAQFDLHKNKGPLKDTIPYVVVQSSLFDGYRRRVVIADALDELLTRS